MVVDCFCWQMVGGLSSSKRKRCMDSLFDAAFWCAESNAEDSKTRLSDGFFSRIDLKSQEIVSLSC